MRQKFSMITLGVADFTASLHFYENVLGWKKSKKSNDGMALFPLGGIIFCLYPLHDLANDAGLSLIGKSSFAGVTLSYNAKSIKEVDDIISKLTNAGTKIVKRPCTAFWGGYHAYFQDPDGYLVEVAYNPFWELDAAGNLVL